MYKQIKILVMDVDGTLTDGRIYISRDEELMKAFNVKDGYGIAHILPQLGIIPVVLTGRESDIVKRRCEELGINHLIQGSNDKAKDLSCLREKLNVDYDEIAYIGDDLNDLECMKRVGVKACPHDAVDEVKEISDYITINFGGNGAVREFIEWLRKNM